MLAREHFGEDDPRLGTSLANAGVALRRAGDEMAAAVLLDEALEVWAACDGWVAALLPEVRARSSLYHLRMQAKHKGGYDRFSQERYQALVEMGRAATHALRDGQSPSEDGPARWFKERPAGYSDARRLMAAALLVSSG